MMFDATIPLDGGAKMSNMLDLYPDGFASAKWSSVDGGKTFQHFSDQFNITTSSAWTSFATYTNASSGHRWAHSFASPGGEVIAGAGKTTFGVNHTFRYEFEPGTSKLMRSPGPPVVFSGLPVPICERNGYFTPYASGHVVFADGLHLQTGMYTTCSPGHSSRVIAAFTSKDGYEYQWISNVSTSK